MFVEGLQTEDQGGESAIKLPHEIYLLYTLSKKELGYIEVLWHHSLYPEQGILSLPRSL